MCIAILLALVPAVAPRETIAVWQQNVQIGQLSRILSSPQQHFACDRNIATRRAHIFVKQASPLAIAEKVAVTLGLNLVRTNSGWRFAADEHYEDLIRTHDAEVEEATGEVLNRVIEHLRRNPPHRIEQRRLTDPTWTARLESPLPIGELTRKEYGFRHLLATYRDDALWALANLNQMQQRDLLDGHAVVAAVPNIPDLIALPGSSADYLYLKDSSQGFLIVEFDADHGRIMATPVKYPRRSNPNATGNAINVLPMSRDLDGETRLGLSMKGWTPNAASYYLPQKHVWKVTGTGQGPAAEHLASVTGRYVIVEASPLKPKDRFDCRNLGFVKESFGWLLIKPPRFWELQKYWWLSNSSFHPKRPPMDDAVLSLDWLSNLALAASEDDWQYLYGSESMDAVHTGLQRRPFARFWLALSRKEKLSALTTGLDRNTLSEVNKKLFLNAVCESLAHCVVQGNVSGLLDPSGEAYLVIRADRHWALLNAYGHSSFRSRSDMLQAIKVGERGRPHQGITFTIEFKSGTGFTRDEAATRFPILDALPIDIDRTGEFE